MRARRSAFERVAEGYELAPVGQARPAASEQDRPAWLAMAASALVHAGFIASLLLLSRGAPPGEEQSAPSFAVEYESAAPDTPTPPSVSQPRVSLGESEAPPPPVEAPSEDAVPLPPIHYGSALKQRRDNPFAHVVPDELASNQRHSHVAGRAGSLMDLSAAPTQQVGRLTDTISHPPGTKVSGDYDARLVAWVESHREDIQALLKGAELGTATLSLRIARDGHVTQMHLISSSGSILLNAAWVTFYRDFKPPPLGADVEGEDYPVNYTLDYVDATTGQIHP